MKNVYTVRAEWREAIVRICAFARLMKLDDKTTDSELEVLAMLDNTVNALETVQFANGTKATVADMVKEAPKATPTVEPVVKRPITTTAPIAQTATVAPKSTPTSWREMVAGLTGQTLYWKAKAIADSRKLPWKRGMTMPQLTEMLNASERGTPTPTPQTATEAPKGKETRVKDISDTIATPTPTPTATPTKGKTFTQSQWVKLPLHERETLTTAPKCNNVADMLAVLRGMGYDIQDNASTLGRCPKSLLQQEQTAPQTANNGMTLKGAWNS